LTEEPEAADAVDPAANVLMDELAEIDPDAMSPRQALDALYRLKALAEKQ